MRSSPPSDAVADERLRLIAESYRRLTGRDLLHEIPSDDEGFSRALWEAPFAVVAHGLEADPVFFYGNRYALRCFEMSFEEFSKLPSRFSAEPLARDARDKLLAQVSQQGYVDGYSGMRIAKSGRRFMITGGTVWNLLDERGVRHGQAALFVARE